MGDSCQKIATTFATIPSSPLRHPHQIGNEIINKCTVAKMGKKIISPWLYEKNEKMKLPTGEPAVLAHILYP